MRVFLTGPELKTTAGQELKDLSIAITEDGKIDADEWKQLRRWLRENKCNTDVAAVPYLCDIFRRIAADGFIDKDELTELHTALERVIPTPT